MLGTPLAFRESRIKVVIRKNVHSLFSAFEVTAPKVTLSLTQIEFKPFLGILGQHLMIFVDTN
jgi:hypothetical protein